MFSRVIRRMRYRMTDSVTTRMSCKISSMLSTCVILPGLTDEIGRVMSKLLGREEKVRTVYFRQPVTSPGS